MKNDTKIERQWDSITKSTLSSSLYHSVFSHVFSCKNPNNFGSLPMRTMEEKRMWKMKSIMLLLISSSISRKITCNAHDNFLMPNVLVNEINDIGVKIIDDGEDA